VKGHYAFDPFTFDDCGEAAAGVSRLVAAWVDVDWFVPPSVEGAQGLAIKLFEEHQARAHALAADLFVPRVRMECLADGWNNFAALAARVRAGTGWDWKYKALKQLSKRHSVLHGWTLAERAPSSLTVRVREDIVIWAAPSPRIDFRKVLPEPEAELAGWYLSYAAMDFIECLEWQLAENSSEIEGNPFVPLLRCYGLGFYPFALGRDELALVSFPRS
jgi:hypothetical protein